MTGDLLQIPTLALGIGMVAIAVFITLMGANFLRRRRTSEPMNDAVPTFYGTVAGVYSILLAFVVVLVAEEFENAETEVVLEATRVSNVLRDSEGLAHPDKIAIHRAARDYIRLTAEKEWASMAEGGGADPEAAAAYRQLWQAVYRAEPRGFVQESFFREMLSRLNELAAARRTRLLSADSHVPGILWILLLGGGMIVVALAYYIPNSSAGAGKMSMIATSCVLALTLFLIFVMDHPYSGNFSVSPAPLEELLPRIERVLEERAAPQ